VPHGDAAECDARAAEEMPEMPANEGGGGVQGQIAGCPGTGPRRVALKELPDG
jgi:hypothetical protein